MRALEFITSQPWLITEEALQQIVMISERNTDIEALSTRHGRPLINARNVTVRDTTAIIPITGPIFRYANLMTEISGATSTQVLAEDFRTALEDPLIKAIVFDINSPGGSATGINELGDMIFQARGTKPVIAYAGGQMASAAYWIGSAADEIIIDATAPVGSIGAVMTIQDTSGRDTRSGVRTIEIVSNQSPDKRIDYSDDEGRAKLQKIVDDLAAVFVDAVARNRNISTEAVLTDYGRGGLRVGRAAVEAGMADRLGSLESVLASLSSARDPSRRSVLHMATKTSKGPVVVASTEELRTALSNGHTAEEITLASVDVEAIRAEAHAAGLAEAEASANERINKASADATTAERARVAGLNSIAMKGFEKEISAAIESGASVEATAINLTKLARTRGTTIQAIQNDSPQAVAHGGALNSDPQAKSAWGKITNRTNERQKKTAPRR